MRFYKTCCSSPWSVLSFSMLNRSILISITQWLSCDFRVNIVTGLGYGKPEPYVFAYEFSVWRSNLMAFKRCNKIALKSHVLTRNWFFWNANSKRYVIVLQMGFAMHNDRFLFLFLKFTSAVLLWQGPVENDLFPGFPFTFRREENYRSLMCEAFAGRPCRKRDLEEIALLINHYNIDI